MKIIRIPKSQHRPLEIGSSLGHVGNISTTSHSDTVELHLDAVDSKYHMVVETSTAELKKILDSVLKAQKAEPTTHYPLPFERAMVELRSGKKIQCEEWSGNEYIQYVDGEIVDEKGRYEYAGALFQNMLLNWKVLEG